MKSISLWTVGLAGSLTMLVASPTLAQLTPDNTLPNNSTIRQDTIEGIPSDVIEEGTQRGGNLFHSFLEFNVNEGRGVYFANPAGIDNILTRVTGGNPSNIFGRLGVLGGANLYLLNPNGIIFGPNSSLSISGSFTATTADGISLGENGLFSAGDPASSNLLEVSPSVLFFNQASQQPGNILNQGNLVVGKNFTLAASNELITLNGVLDAGGDLTLSVENDGGFLVMEEGKLTAGGNLALEAPDIFAFGEFESRGGNLTFLADVSLIIGGTLTAGGNLDLSVSMGQITINSNSVLTAKTGNLTISSSGDLTIFESSKLTAEVGNLTLSSSMGKIGILPNNQLTAGGDLTLSSSFSPMVDILVAENNQLTAGGNLTLSSPTITVNPGSKLTATTGNLTLRGNEPGISVNGSVLTSGGNFRVEGINGSLVRLGSVQGIKIDTGGDVSIGSYRGESIKITAGGTVEIPGFVEIGGANGLLVDAGGDVSINSYTGGSLRILAGGKVAIPGFIQVSSADSVNGIAEQVTLSDGTTVSIDGKNQLTVDILAGRMRDTGNTGTPTSADINVGTIFFGFVDADGNFNPLTGTVLLTNQDKPNSNLPGSIQITATPIAQLPDNILEGVAIQTVGNEGGGAVTIDSKGSITIDGTINTSSAIDAQAPSNFLGTGGNVTLLAKGDITGSSITSTGQSGGQIMIDGNNVNIRLIDTTGSLGGGSVTINADGILQMDVGINASALNQESDPAKPASFLGNGGNITLNAGGNITIPLLFSQGEQGGQITLSRGNDVSINSIDATGRLGGGSVTINANGKLEINDSINTSVFNQELDPVKPPNFLGNGGNITLNAGGDITSPLLVSQGERGGQIMIDGNNVNIRRINARGSLGGGSVTVDADGILQMDVGIDASALNQELDLTKPARFRGNGGNITLNAGGNLTISSLVSQGEQGGQITLSRGNDVSINSIDATGRLGGGSVTINANGNIQINIGITTSVFNIESDETKPPNFLGNGGNITLNAGGDINFTSGSELLSQGQSGGKIILTGRDINLTPNTTIVSRGQSGGQITFDSQGTIFIRGVVTTSGNLEIKNAELVEVSGTTLFNDSLTSSRLQALGNLTLTTENLRISDGAGITGANIIVKDAESIEVSGVTLLNNEFTSSEIQASGGNIDLTTGSLLITNGGQIDTTGAGNINITATQIEVLGRTSDGQFPSAIFTNRGNITFTTGSLLISSGGEVSASGNLEIKNSESVTVSGGIILPDNTFKPSLLSATGNLTLDTGNLIIADGGRVLSMDDLVVTSSESVTVSGITSLNIQSPFIELAAIGNLTLTIGTLFIRDGAQIAALGNIVINASESITVTGTTRILELEPEQQNPSSIYTLNRGNLEIETGRLIVSDGGQVGSRTFGGQTSTGNTTIRATEIEVVGVTDGTPFPSSISTTVDAGATGNSGNLTIETERLTVRNGGLVGTGTFASGDSGNVTITATEVDISGFGTTPDGQTFSSSLFTVVGPETTGNSGNLTLNTEHLTISNGGQILAGTRSVGNSGSIDITATDVEILGAASFGSIQSPSSILTVVSPDVTDNNGNIIKTGNSGGITLITERLSVRDGGKISTNRAGSGTTGNLEVIASESAEFISTALSGQDVSNDLFPVPDDQEKGNLSLLIGRLQRISLIEGQQVNEELNQPPNQLPSGLSVTGTSNIDLKTGNLIIRNGAQISTSRSGGNGNIIIKSDQSVEIIGNAPGNQFASGIVTSIAPTTSQGGNVTLETQRLIIRDGAFIDTGTEGTAAGGDLTIRATESVQLTSGRLLTSANVNATGRGGKIDIQTGTLTLDDNSQINARTLGQGDAGDINITVEQLLSASNSRITASVDQQAAGTGGEINIQANTILLNNAQINSRSLGLGDAGSITLTVEGMLNATNNSEITAFAQQAIGGEILIDAATIALNGSQITAETRGQGNAGKIEVTTNSLTLGNSEINARTSGQGNSGKITLSVRRSFQVTNSNITAFAQQAIGGDIDINAATMILDNSQITAQTFGQGNAGNINIRVDENLQTTDSQITTSAQQASGGQINMTAQDIRLNGNSDIRTNVESGAGGGGNINLQADSVIAFDDSDIIASARDGRGGDITFDTPVFFGEGFQEVQNANQDGLDGNGRVDINASGAISGVIRLPDLSTILNSIARLPTNLINTESLIARSCVIPSQEETGKFILTGSGGIPESPGGTSVSPYPTGEPRTVDTSSSRPWQMGDPIIEPQGFYRLTNGKVVLSRKCS